VRLCSPSNGWLAYDPAVDFTPPAAPTTQKGRERREQILDAAAEAFAVQGYRNVSLASIAPVVGITAQGVMHYFPTKTDLLLGVLERRKERDTVHFTSMLRELGITLPDLLIEVMRHNVEDEPGLATLDAVIGAESVDPAHPTHGWYAARNERLRRDLAVGVEQSKAAGEMRADLDASAIAAQILAMLDGLILQWALEPGSLDVVAAMREYVRTLRAPD
jgi:AcrR family transcriptional regulator